MNFFIRARTTLLATLISSCALASESLPVKNEIEFAKLAKNQTNLPMTYIIDQLKQVDYDASIIKSINSPAENRTWDWYKDHLITQKRIKDGVKYWLKHRQILNTARRRYGVNPGIIVAIIAIETNFGKNEGHYPILNALGTLAFYNKSRSLFFQSELEKFLVLKHKYNWHHILSSYAGAFGIPQFMPGSFEKYATSKNAARNVDIVHNHNSAILSIARYLSSHGWNKDQYVILPGHYSSPLTLKRLIQSTRSEAGRRFFKKYHIKKAEEIQLIKLNTKTGNNYRLALPNFKCIETYNNSVNYAMAVNDLSRYIQYEIKRHHSDNIQ